MELDITRDAQPPLTAVALCLLLALFPSHLVSKVHCNTSDHCLLAALCVVCESLKWDADVVSECHGHFLEKVSDTK